MKRAFNTLLAVMVLLSLAAAISTPVTAENNTINVPEDYETIQEAIDAASDGDTIVVAAGIYEENVVIHRSLTLQGVQAGVDARDRSGEETIIQPDDPEEDTAIEIVSAAGRVVVVDGLTVRNARHGITAPEPVMAEHITIRNVRALNCVRFGITAAYTTEATIENCYVVEAEFGINAGALTPFMPTMATIRHNEIANTEFGISGYLEDSLIEGNLVRDFTQEGGVGISGQFFNTEIKDNTVTGYTRGGAISFEWHVYRELPKDVTVEGNTITGNSIGVYVFDTQTELDGIVVRFNNIEGNTRYGVWNKGGETLDAARNWWGASDGPRGHGTGTGDSVSTGAVFEPWLGAPLVTVQTETVINEIMDVRAEADAEVEVDGTATVTVAKYGANPGDAPICLTPLDKYIDVYVPDTGAVDGIEIRLYYTGSEAAEAGVAEESLRLFWWDGTEWVQCSEGGVDTDGADGYSYIWATITGDSAPSLAQLTGTPFAGYALPPPLPYIATAELPDGRVGVAYNATVHGCGGAEPYAWAVVDGALPDGLANNADTGIISGTPTRAGVFNFTFKVTDSAQATETAELSITIPEPIPCFIATAAYGSNTAQEIDILREFRDSVMLSSSLGAGFVAIYYRASPTAAELISRHEGLRTLVRVGLIDPIVRIADSTRHLWSESG